MIYAENDKEGDKKDYKITEEKINKQEKHYT